jgi:hypothetical protein
MTTYRLQRVSASVYDITSGRKKVGFVRASSAAFVARIGKERETAATAERAFEAVVARACGFRTPVELAAHNRGVRARNREVRTVAGHAVREAVENNNFEPFLDLLWKM